jgi:hypothetical protein
LVVGDSDTLEHFERRYRGRSTPGASGNDVVTCSIEATRFGVELSVLAGPAGVAKADAELRFILPRVAAGEFSTNWSEQSRDVVRVRLGDGDAFRFHEYAFGVDEVSGAGSRCQVYLSQLDRQGLVGTLACRALVSTFSSLDAAAAGEPSDRERASATATLEFDCPLLIPSEAGAGGSGNTAGTTGSGGGVNVAGSGQGGSTAMGTQCTGTSVACSLRGRTTCQLGQSCILTESCSGVATSCYLMLDAAGCNSQSGCLWSPSGKSCSLSPTSCGSFVAPGSCAAQQGCRWNSDCSGAAPSCSTLKQAECELESGCQWQ